MKPVGLSMVAAMVKAALVGCGGVGADSVAAKSFVAGASAFSPAPAPESSRSMYQPPPTAAASTRPPSTAAATRLVPPGPAGAGGCESGGLVTAGAVCPVTAAPPHRAARLALTFFQPGWSGSPFQSPIEANWIWLNGI